MVTPSPEQWACLTAVEKLNFRLMDLVNRTPALKSATSKLGSTLGKAWVELATSRTITDHGFENFKLLDPSRGVLLVSNHRSFFDLFVVSARLFRQYGLHHNIHFPVRSNFFYTNVLGLLINVPVGAACIYPPIVRGKERREWNRFAMDLMVELLENPKNMVGFHPEGTRNRGADPYLLLPGKAGCGELIHRARPNVVPLFLQGFPRYAWHVPLLNLNPFRTPPTLVHMVMGEPMDFSSEYRLEAGPDTYQAVADKVMRRIQDLGQQERQIRERFRKAG